METIEPSHFPGRRAAGVAANCINFTFGGPHQLYVYENLTSVSKESIAEVGNKYHLKCSMKDSLNKESEIPCTAQVLYYYDKTPPDVTFTLQPEPQNYTAAKDQEFFNRMMNMKSPLEVKDIPDDMGNIAPDMEPVYHFAMAVASFIKWKQSTEETQFAMTIIKYAKLLKNKDVLEYRFTFLIHDIVSQEIIPWEITGTWSPSERFHVESHKQLAKNYREAGF
ncbi:latexin [Gastrophryne carolinensis]